VVALNQILRPRPAALAPLASQPSKKIFFTLFDLARDFFFF
jgi:hypothetical protein